AGVMAHEISHVAACHVAREQTRYTLMEIATIPLIFVGGGIGYGAYELAGPAAMLDILQFARGFEAEADSLGVQSMCRAGFDPSAFVACFGKTEAVEKK